MTFALGLALICFQQILIVLTAAVEYDLPAHEPTFVGSLKNVTVIQGGDASFTCKVHDLGDYKISVDGNTLLAVGNIVITRDQKWAKLSATKSGRLTWTLHIRNVRRTHQGFYMCQIRIAPMITMMQMAYLEVLFPTPPDIISNETTSDLVVPEGGSAKLFCKATGIPKPNIVWRKEDDGLITVHGEELKEKMVYGEVLTLSNITRSEMGAYLCIASNDIPPSVSKRILVMAHFPPQISVVNQMIGAQNGIDVTLECLSEAYPKALTYWTRSNGELIINNTKFIVEEEILSHYGVRMRLPIQNNELRDYTGYTCVSHNSMGDAEETIQEISNTSLEHQPIEESAVSAGDTPPPSTYAPPISTDTSIRVSSSPNNNYMREAPGLNFCLSSLVIKAVVPWCASLSSLLP